MKKEVGIFLSIVILFSLILHPDFLSSPIERISNLPSSGAYGLGMFHPLIFGFIIYLIFYGFRVIFKWVVKLLKK